MICNFRSVTKANDIKTVLIVMSTVLLYLFSFSVFAESLYIQDIAKVLSPQMSSRLEQAQKEIENKHKLHIELVILPNLYGKPKEAVVKAFFQQLESNASEIDKRALLMIIVNGNDAELVVTPNLATIYTPVVSKKITDRIISKLQAKNYDEAAKTGLTKFFDYYTNQTTDSSANKRMKSHLTIILNIFVVIAIVVLFFKMRSKPKS